MNELLRLRDVCRITGLSKTKLYGLIKLGEFPRQYHLAPPSRLVGWKSCEIEVWVCSRPLVSVNDAPGCKADE